MKVGIMQPYLFPYLGYFQLIEEVDVFVLLDDVNYIKKGFINRNSILLNKTAHTINLPLQKASQNKKINELYIANDSEQFRKFKSTIHQGYVKSVNYQKIEKLMKISEDNIAFYNYSTIIETCDLLSIKTKIIKSSSIFNNVDLKGQDRILDICKQLNASTYINPIGGKELYNHRFFKDQGVELKFLKKNHVTYPQLANEFVDNLSILDVIANNSVEDIKHKLLKEFTYE